MEDRIIARQMGRQKVWHKGQKSQSETEAKLKQAATEEDRKRRERHIKEEEWLQSWDLRGKESFSGDLFVTQENQEQARRANKKQENNQVSQLLTNQMFKETSFIDPRLGTGHRGLSGQMSNRLIRRDPESQT